MEIKNNTYTSFNGYDARQLKGLFVTDKRCIDALRPIIKQTRLDLYTPNIPSKSVRKELAELTNKNYILWAQDYFTNVKNNIDAIIFDRSREHLTRVLKASAEGLSKTLGVKTVSSNPHLRGGNFFICEVNGKKKLLIDELKSDIYPEDMMKKIYNVDEICPLPKLDYHLDLFIRPLDNGKVLVADDELTRKGLQDGIKKVQKYIQENNLQGKEKEQIYKVLDKLKTFDGMLDTTFKYAPYKPQETLPKVVEALEQSEMKPIRVPGTYLYLDGYKDVEKEKELLNNLHNNLQGIKNYGYKNYPDKKANVDEFIQLIKASVLASNPNLGVDLVNMYKTNFINAIVHKLDNKLIYITNESLADIEAGITPEIEKKIGFSFKKMFTDSVSPYIDKENIYFINEKLTEKLFKYMGGIHCTAAEIVK